MSTTVDDRFVVGERVIAGGTFPVVADTESGMVATFLSERGVEEALVMLRADPSAAAKFMWHRVRYTPRVSHD